MSKKRTMIEEEKRRKELIKGLLREALLKNGQDLNNIIKEFIAEIVNGNLEGELDDELGYNKYNIQNKKDGQLTKRFWTQNPANKLWICRYQSIKRQARKTQSEVF